MLDQNDSIILAGAAQGGALASLASEQTGLTRVAVSRRIKKLADGGYLKRHGNGTRQTYTLGEHRFWLGLQARQAIEKTGGEMAVWERHLAPLLKDLKPNVKSLANTAFTEMLNNALDHSSAQQVAMGMQVRDGQLQMLVADDGIGIFGRIAQSAQLFDTRLALLELAKGKFTSASQGHSGMGVFVSSRMMDGFAIESGGLLFDPHELTQPLPRFDWMNVNGLLKPAPPGTEVRMALGLNSLRKANDVYFKYFDPDEIGAEAFHTTEIPVRLAQLSSELVSRSQAKWVMERAIQFKTVVLDFEGVAHVGQAFMDEVFRVFATNHPHIRLQTTGMSPEVAKLARLFGGTGA
ncbi:STAS-like domain-containing protein [Limnohabitans sp.]|jgi:anti-sigma regulatory factor (Ser/Thr protein kinase)|uniref:STAS-like domain-containing protein n=1 Tax=Limnohabitans sp. TaxID=1907725 RepID=UPI0037BE7AB8